MSKIRNGWLDQYGAKPFKQQQFETAGVEGVKSTQYEHRLHTGVKHSLTFPRNGSTDRVPSIPRDVDYVSRQTRMPRFPGHRPNSLRRESQPGMIR